MPDTEMAGQKQTSAFINCYILARFREIELTKKHRPRVAHLDQAPMAEAELHDGLGAPELEFYAESFYLTAFRLREVLRNLPHFRKFEAIGVRDVRNFLIQHPEKPRGVMARNYTYDIPQGFIIKPFGGKPGRAEDRGLFLNAEEFVTKLLRKLHALGCRSTGVSWLRMRRS